MFRMSRLIHSYIILVIMFATCCNSGFAQNPAQIVSKALSCFNDKYVYTSCNEAYRLTQSGYINVPSAATDQYCYGPCLAETHLVLDCLDRAFKTFVFYNKATTNTLRATLQAACGHSNLRGNFNVEEYMRGYLEDEWNNANGHHKTSNLFIFVFVYWILFFIVREML